MRRPEDFSPRDRERIRLEVKDAIRTIRGMAEGHPVGRSEVVRDGRRLLVALRQTPLNSVPVQGEDAGPPLPLDA